MTEEEPLKGGEEMEPTRVPLKGPNVISTFDTPPSADAVRAQDAAIRKHLRDRKPRNRPDDA
jgi:hypothetical protein